MRRLRVLWVAAAILTVWMPGAARADVFGADLTHQPVTSTYGLSLTQVTDPGGAATAGSPTAGVLTSVRIRTSGTATTGTIRVLRLASHPPGEYDFTKVAEVPVSVTADASPAGHITETAVQVPIAAGDRLAWKADDAGGATKETVNDPTAECAYTAGDSPVGATAAYTTAGCNHNVPLLSGTVEPDADSDGYGDVTQDQCPSDASLHAAACSADVSLTQAVASAFAPVGVPITFTLTVANAGPSPAAGVTVTDTVPAGATLHSAAPSTGTCSAAGGTLTCALGTLATGASATVTLVLIPAAVGPLTNTATAAAGTADPQPANNTSSASATATTGDGPPPPPPPPPAAPVLSALRVSPARFAPARSGPAATAAAARGAQVTFTLSAAARVHFTITRTATGRRGSGGLCVAPAPRTRRGRACRRTITVGGFTRAATAGPNQLRLTGRLNGRPLPPRAYRLTATPTAAGRSGATVSVAFRVAR